MILPFRTALFGASAITHSRPKACGVLLALELLRPARFGTSTVDGPDLIVTLTELPTFTFAPASGLCVMVRPLGTVSLEVSRRAELPTNLRRLQWRTLLQESSNLLYKPAPHPLLTNTGGCYLCLAINQTHVHQVR